MNFEQIEKEIERRAADHCRNKTPYKQSIEEYSGFVSGVSWALKKAYQLGLLKADSKRED